MSKTSIEWTDHSVNPLRALLNGRKGHYCEKVSHGCKNCYSSRLQPRFGMPQFQEQRHQGIEHTLEPKPLLEVLRRRKPTKYFWCDMTDMFGDWVPFEWIAACFGVMAATPQHTHQVLTKRPQRALEFFRWLDHESCHPFGPSAAAQCGIHAANCGADIDYLGLPDVWPLPNVWLGTSAENQEQADKRLPLLLQCPAAVRWVSAEPLLGPLKLSNYGTGALLNWVVVGGESGHGARPFKLEWAETIVRQCQAAGVPVFVKQLGAKPIGVALDMPVPYEAPFPIKHRKGGDIAEFPEHLRVRQFPKVRA